MAVRVCVFVRMIRCKECFQSDQKSSVNAAAISLVSLSSSALLTWEEIFFCHSPHGPAAKKSS